MRRSLLVLLIWGLVAGRSYAEDFAIEVYQQKAEAVVLIVAGSGGRSPMVGAGSIIDRSGSIVTNAHVVIDKRISEPFSSIKVYFKPERVTGSRAKDLAVPYSATVRAFDLDLDLAVIKVEYMPEEIDIIDLAAPDEVRIGQEVLAIGHPEQGGFWSLTYGRISGEIADQKGVEGKNVYQTDTSVNRGNSGGPLLDKRGYMVGINTNIARLGAGNLAITGVNFALKSEVVKTWLDEQRVLVSYGSEPLQKDVSIAGTAAGKRIPNDRILTPKNPYKIDDVFKRVESDMEDMMKDMKSRIR